MKHKKILQDTTESAYLNGKVSPQTETQPATQFPFAVEEGKRQKSQQNAVFPLSVGHRFRYDRASQEILYTPLCLADLLDPTENQQGIFFMAEGPSHDLIATLLATILRLYAKLHGWLILRDVRVDWAQKSLKPQYPDITAVFQGRFPPQGKETYKVGRDGGTPEFLIEITSKETRLVDLEAKPLLYAAAGVQEMLVIDIHPPRKGVWKLLGYQLSALPPYKQAIPADTEGGVSFASIGLRFVARGRDAVDIYEMATGQRLLPPEDLQARLHSESIRAEELARQLSEAKAQLQSLRQKNEVHSADKE